MSGHLDQKKLKIEKELLDDSVETSPEKVYRTPRIIDWDKINKSKKITGMRGEEIVMEIEQQYLGSMNRQDLADKVKHVSKEKGDGLGYDILSYFTDEREKYIEVKSTKKEESNSFFISKNELDFMKENKENFYIYRVFNVNENNKESYLKVYDVNEILNSSEITPTQYKIKME